MIKEKCGVAGVFLFDPNESAAYEIYKILLSQFTRGQEGAGIVVYDHLNNTMRLRKDSGRVRDIFSKLDFSIFTGNVGIGHNRYGTVDARSKGIPINRIVQPLTTETESFYLSHNGTLSPHSLKELRKYSGNFSSDTEALALAIERELDRTHNLVDAMMRLDEVLDGSYSCTLLTRRGELVAFRDPKGFKPLVIGEIDGGYAIASETSPLEFQLHAKNIRPVEPGEIITINDQGEMKRDRFAEPVKHAHCAFEWVYFSNPASYFEGINTEKVRVKLGKILARKNPVKADSVGPVPDSGRSCALGYHLESGLPMIEYLQANRELGRVFITPDEKARRRARELKYSVLKEEVAGMRIVLCDDSIVRCTTSEYLVSLLKRYGAKEVHLRISFPPIIEPCLHGGIAFSTRRELAYHKYKEVKGIKEAIGADSLAYTSANDLREAIGLDDICTACVTGTYPLKHQISADDKEIKELGYVR